MPSPADYRDYVKQCMRMAKEAKKPHAKVLMVSLARAWVLLAEQAQQTQQLGETASPRPSECLSAEVLGWEDRTDRDRNT